MEYKILYIEIIFIIKPLEAKIAKIQAEEPSRGNAVVMEVWCAHITTFFLGINVVCLPLA